MKPFSVAMWDFSWATRRSGNEAEYRDWERVLDELADRGYDCVRIDAFPHLIGSGPADSPVTTSVIGPQRKRFMWGNHIAVEIRPRHDLLGFVTACADRGIGVALSSWFIPDASDRRREVVTPDDFVRVWDETLRCLAEADLLDSVVWVDLCNEFPLDVWAPGAARQIFGHAFRRPVGVALRGLPWREIWAQRTQQYLTDAVGELKERWPGMRFCYSYHGLVGGQLRRLDSSAFDVAEVHCWLTDGALWNLWSLQVLPLLEVPMGAKLHAWRMAAVSRRRIERWVDSTLDPVMREWASWASVESLPLITSEGWGPTNYVDQTAIDAEWRWIRDVSELAVERAIDLGWIGICTNNFCQPHHRGMWTEVGWHRELTDEIRRAGTRRS